MQKNQSVLLKNSIRYKERKNSLKFLFQAIFLMLMIFHKQGKPLLTSYNIYRIFELLVIVSPAPPSPSEARDLSRAQEGFLILSPYINVSIYFLRRASVDPDPLLNSIVHHEAFTQ